MKAKSDQYKTKARKLKKLGLLNVDIDLRKKEYSSQQKRAITNAAKKYSHFITPRSKRSVKQFKAVHVPSKANRDNYAKHGYHVVGRRVILDVDNYDSIKPQKSIKLPGGKRLKIPGSVLKRQRGQKITYEFLASGPEMQQVITQVDEYIDNLPSTKGITVAGKFGDNDTFKYGRFSSLEELELYMQNFQAKPTRQEKRDLKRGSKKEREKVYQRINKDTETLKSQFAIVVIEPNRCTKIHKGKRCKLKPNRKRST